MNFRTNDISREGCGDCKTVTSFGINSSAAVVGTVSCAKHRIMTVRDYNIVDDGF